MISAKHWQQSYSGQIVTPRHLLPEQVRFEDIPHSLAQKVRFNGQLFVPGYTVAQHCCMGAEEFILRGEERFALPFLLHEVDEVYLPDVPSPIKGAVRVVLTDREDETCTWGELCDQHADAMFAALGLTELRPLLQSPEVHDMDLRMLLTEKRDLMGQEPVPWGIPGEPLPFKIDPVWDYSECRERFTYLYRQLRARWEFPSTVLRMP